ncbi:Serine/threonine phosphatase stp [Propionibacterium australiense]|uniref:PPM-type phosphatase domain n=2 Tax=Propionibacterium australiense TaxID=119981 RepID=A0A383S377_9ACTN|nr:PPM-type phosphatase domain [Propionibacterium australiense]VEH90207.1 Serine/threonine phosphatase stp [Propionibacterium australiense]
MLNWSAHADQGNQMTTGPRATERDDLRRGPVVWAGGASHVGTKNPPNQDALAVAATNTAAHHSAIAAVSDGVSTSPRSELASQIAVDAATDSLIDALTRHPTANDPDDLCLAMRMAVLTAQDEIVTQAGNDIDGYACTLVLSLFHRGLIIVANVGDSRAYWFGDGGTNMILTTDDSMAQLSISLGTPREIAEASAQAHAITKWLGPSSPGLDPTVSAFRVAESGWLMVCTDGLWNYASDADALRHVFNHLPVSADASAEKLSVALVDWANEQGGHDNISVGLIRIEEEDLRIAPARARQETPSPAPPNSTEAPPSRAQAVEPDPYDTPPQPELPL